MKQHETTRKEQAANQSQEQQANQPWSKAGKQAQANRKPATF